MPQSPAELCTGGSLIRNGEPNDPDRPQHAAADVSERRHAHAAFATYRSSKPSSHPAQPQPWTPCVPPRCNQGAPAAATCTSRTHARAPDQIDAMPSQRKVNLTTTLLTKLLTNRSHNRGQQRTRVTNRQPQGRTISQADCRWHGRDQGSSPLSSSVVMSQDISTGDHGTF
jgi:hypothetical protein